MFLITDSESTHKVTSIGKFLGWMSIFMESWAPNPDFGQNPVFAVREQLHRLRTKPTPDSDSPWSKVPPAIWNLVLFDRMCATSFGKSDLKNRFYKVKFRSISWNILMYSYRNWRNVLCSPFQRSLNACLFLKIVSVCEWLEKSPFLKGVE